MADDNLVDDAKNGEDVEVEVGDIDADDEEFDDDVDEEFELVDEVLVVDEDLEVEDDEEEDDVATPMRPATDDEEDEDDDEVEADLDAILKDRIAAGDDEDEEDDDDDVKPARPTPTPAGDAEPVLARQQNEFSCPNCFLLVNSKAVVDDECPHCGGPVVVP